MQLCAKIVLATVLSLTSGCSRNDPERYVIVGDDSTVFLDRELQIDARRDDEIIAAVRRFANKNEMDFLLARESLGAGEFNVSANGPKLNLKAMHLQSFDGGVRVFGLTNHRPTESDRAKADEFVGVVQNAARHQAKPHG